MKPIHKMRIVAPMQKIIKVFLIEDDNLDQRQIERAFNQKGVLCNMHIFNNAERALDVLLHDDGAQYPDIILLDINMPLMNGVEFLSEIRKHEKFSSLKIFVLSNSDHERTECESLGVSGYIMKPLKLNSPSMDTIKLMIDMMNI